MSRFLSQIDEARFIALINALLRTRCGQPKRRCARTFIIDGAAITLDLNVFRKKNRKADLEDKDYKLGYSNANGYYIGFKLTLVIEHPSLVPVAFLIHTGSPHDSKLFPEVLGDLKRRKVLRAEDTVICDKGYYEYDNYAIGVRDYKVVPLYGHLLLGSPGRSFPQERARGATILSLLGQLSVGISSVFANNELSFEYDQCYGFIPTGSIKTRNVCIFARESFSTIRSLKSRREVAVLVGGLRGG